MSGCISVDCVSMRRDAIDSLRKLRWLRFDILYFCISLTFTGAARRGVKLFVRGSGYLAGSFSAKSTPTQHCRRVIAERKVIDGPIKPSDSFCVSALSACQSHSLGGIFHVEALTESTT